MATAKATKGKSKGKRKGKPQPVPQEGALTFRESDRVLRQIDLRLIKSSLNDNHRYPYSKAMEQAGYGMFKPLPTHPDLPPLWSLATSDSPAQRAEFLRIMNHFEQPNPADRSCLDLANSIHAGILGQIHPMQVKPIGKPKVKGGPPSGGYQLVSGHRRCTAILWLWASGLRDEPIGEFEEVIGNSLELSVLQTDENDMRKKVDVITIAQGYRRQLQTASEDKVAAKNHISVQTLNRYLGFLELEPKEQELLKNGKLRQEDADKIVKNRREGGDGKTHDGLTAEEASQARPAKGGTRRRVAGKWPTSKIEEAFSNPPTDWPGIKPDTIRRVLGVILGKLTTKGKEVGDDEDDGKKGRGSKNDEKSTPNDTVAVLPIGLAQLDAAIQATEESVG